MKTLIYAAFAIAALSVPAVALEPIPGSMTYPTQPRSKLYKAPVGSIVHHTFTDEFGHRFNEKYVINPDRSLKLVQRTHKN